MSVLINTQVLIFHQCSASAASRSGQFKRIRNRERLERFWFCERDHGKGKEKNAHPCHRPLWKRLTFPWSIARYTLIARSRVCFQTLEKPRKKEGASEKMWCHGDNPSIQQCCLGSNPGSHRFESYRAPRCFSLSLARDMLIISSLQKRESWYLIKFTVVNSRCHRMFVAHYPILYFRFHNHQCQLQSGNTQIFNRFHIAAYWSASNVLHLLLSQ